MKEQRYIISVENTNSRRMYFRRTEGYSGAAPVTIDPHLAQHWELGDKKTDILAQVERMRRNISNSSELKASTIRVELFEWQTTAVDGADSEWVANFRDNALTKLTTQEIEALGISNMEVFRRLKQ